MAKKYILLLHFLFEIHLCSSVFYSPEGRIVKAWPCCHVGCGRLCEHGNEMIPTTALCQLFQLPVVYLSFCHLETANKSLLKEKKTLIQIICVDTHHYPGFAALHSRPCVFLGCPLGSAEI